MNNLTALVAAWVECKRAENEFTTRRREIEEEITLALNLPESMEGSQTEVVGRYEVKITGRMNRKIDAEKLQDIALEHGLSDHLPVLFRWKPEINMTLWRHADESITRPLMAAITTTPGRPSFSITEKE